jgi:hypothetical protein
MAANLEGIIEVEVPSGPIGVKLTHGPPLKILGILELPNGEKSPLQDKVPINSIVRQRTDRWQKYFLNQRYACWNSQFVPA